MFDALATAGARAAFWAEFAVESDGGSSSGSSRATPTRSRIVERDPPRMFAIDYFGAVARFELVPDGAGGTDLLLTHDGVPAHEWNEVHAGWLNVLLPLKAWLAHRVDLRNHDATRSWDQGYADQ